MCQRMRRTSAVMHYMVMSCESHLEESHVTSLPEPNIVASVILLEILRPTSEGTKESYAAAQSLLVVLLLSLVAVSVLPLGAAHADTVIATIPMPGSAGESTVNPNTNMIYVQGYGYNNGWIAVIDGSTNSVVSQIPQTNDGWGYPLGIAANPNTNKIYADGGLGVEVIDGALNSIVAIIPVTCSGDVAVNPNTNEVYVSDHFGSSVCVI